MDKVRHVGIHTKDPRATADFFIDAFGMVEVEFGENDEWGVISDGYVNVTLLGFEYDRYGGGYSGLHHLGFHVNDLDEAGQRVLDAGGQDLTFWNETYGNSEGTPDNWVGEKKYMDPDGIALDVNPSGWQIRPGGERGEGTEPTGFAG